MQTRRRAEHERLDQTSPAASRLTVCLVASTTPTTTYQKLCNRANNVLQNDRSVEEASENAGAAACRRGRLLHHLPCARPRRSSSAACTSPRTEFPPPSVGRRLHPSSARRPSWYPLWPFGRDSGREFENRESNRDRGAGQSLSLSLSLPLSEQESRECTQRCGMERTIFW